MPTFMIDIPDEKHAKHFLQLVEHLSFVKQITTQKEKQPKLRKHQHYSKEELETFSCRCLCPHLRYVHIFINY